MCNRSKYTRISTVFLIGIATILFGPGYMYMIRTKSQSRQLYSLKEASEHLVPFFEQNLMTSLVPILLFLVCAFLLKKDFAEAICLKVKDKKQVWYIGVLTAILGIMAVVGIALKKDATAVLYSLFYFLVFVAFLEEFVFRGLCSYLLLDCSWKTRYIIPNFLFAMTHIFAYNNFEALTAEYVFSFIASDLAGLFIMGCVFQLIKEKTETLWVPILVHAMCDFAGIFV